MRIWSGKGVSNSRPQPWQGCTLPTELKLRKIIGSELIHARQFIRLPVAVVVERDQALPSSIQAASAGRGPSGMMGLQVSTISAPSNVARGPGQSVTSTPWRASSHPDTFRQPPWRRCTHARSPTTATRCAALRGCAVPTARIQGLRTRPVSCPPAHAPQQPSPPPFASR